MVRIRASLYRRPTLPDGTLEWDSGSGKLSGSLADRVRASAEEAKSRGYVWVDDRQHPIDDPLHRPDEMAAILSSLGYILPEPLLRPCYQNPAATSNSVEPRGDAPGAPSSEKSDLGKTGAFLRVRHGLERLFERLFRLDQPDALADELSQEQRDVEERIKATQEVIAGGARPGKRRFHL